MNPIPPGRPLISDEDIEAVDRVLRGHWLTTGPNVHEFEAAFADVVRARFAVAMSSATAALHAAMAVLDLKPGDEVIVPTLTFVASANCIVYTGAIPVFADVNNDTLLLDPNDVERKITPRTRAIIAVDYAGQPCRYDELARIAQHHGLALVADASHSLGGSFKQRPVGTLADLNVFSFHPIKPITTGEGGMVVTQSGAWTDRLRRFRNHGIDSDHREREEKGTWHYDMVELGYNYRITDMQCALGLSQLRNMSTWTRRRQWIAGYYDAGFGDLEMLRLPYIHEDVTHAHHLYPVRLRLDSLKATREVIYHELRNQGIGVNVHYRPVHLHRFYRDRFKTKLGTLPIAEQAYEELLSLPIFPAMSDDDVTRVIDIVRSVLTNGTR